MPSMAGTSPDVTWCKGNKSFTACCFSPWITSVSQRVQAVNSSLVSLVCWSAAAVDVETGTATGWMTSKTTGIGTIRRSAGANGTMMNEGSYLDKVKLMIDSGSQSTACSVDLEKDYATDDTGRAKLWDIQDQKIEAHGKKIVDVKFYGQTRPLFQPASKWMCPMSRETLLRWADC